MKVSSSRRGAVDTLIARFGIVPFACIIALVALLGAGSITWHSSTTYGHEAHARPRQLGVIPDAVTPAPAAAPDIAISPTRIVIPSLKTSAPIIKVGTTPDGELDVPLNPRTVGWWSPGARPGATKGTAILAGHINYAGVDGAMSQIGKLTPGDTVQIFGSVNAGHKQEVTFRVKGVRTYHKTRLPYQQIFNQNSIGRIAIVTCGGPFDAATGNYLDNIVVFATPVTTT